MAHTVQINKPYTLLYTSSYCRGRYRLHPNLEDMFGICGNATVMATRLRNARYMTAKTEGNHYSYYCFVNDCKSLLERK